MKKILYILLAVITVACSSNGQKEAEELLRQAGQLFQQSEYERALAVIDSLRATYPHAIEARKQALVLQQDIELKRSQEELAVVDSMLQAAKQDYERLMQLTDSTNAKQAHKPDGLSLTPEEIDTRVKARLHRDSLQTRFDVICAKIRYIHKKQKENGK